jgi:PAS domain S-box-containing protein
MPAREKTKAQLIAEIKELKHRVHELEKNQNGSPEAASKKESISNLQKLEALFDNVDVLLWSVREEPDGELFYEKVNDIFAGVTGRVPSDYEGKPVRVLGSEEDLQQIRNSLENSKRKSVYTYYKSVGQEPEKRTFILRIISIPLKGGAYYYIGSGIDISDRVKAEEALQKEKNRVQTYLDIAGVLLLVIGSDEKVKLINRKGCEILTCDEEDAIDKNWFDTFVPRRIREDIRNRFKNLMNGSEPKEHYENAIMTKLGVEKMILWYNAILNDENGNSTGLLCSGEDITERKIVEQELQRHTKTIEALYQLSTEITRSTDLNNLLQRTTKLLAENPGIIAGAIYLLNEDKDSIHLKKSFGSKKTFYESAVSLPLSHPFVDSVINNPGVLAEILFDKKEIDKVIGHRVSVAMYQNNEFLGILSMILKDVDDYALDLFGLIASEFERSIIRKKSEQELLSIKQTLEKITFTSPTFISVFDIPNKKILFSNHSVLESLGYPPIEVQRISSLPYPDKRYMYHPDDQKILDEFEKRTDTLNDGEINETEYRIKGYDGEWYWFRHLAAIFARGEKGEIIQTVNIMENISSRKRGEQELLETKQLIEKITETSPAIINVFDTRTHANVYENRSLIKSLGYSNEIEEYLGSVSLSERLKFLFHPDDIKIIEEFYDTIPYIKDGEVYEMEFRMKDTSGRYQWIRRLSSVFHRDEKGIPIQMVSIFENITQGKLTDEKLRQKTDQLICQQASLLELVRMKDFDLDSAFRGISELTSKTLNSDRVSIWLFEKEQQDILCKDLFETGSNLHKNGFRFNSEKFIRYFEHLDFDHTTLLVQGEIDPGLTDFVKDYLLPFQTTAMLAVRVRMHGEIVGVICFETNDPHRMWTIEEQDFATSVSSVISLALEVAERKRTEVLLSKRTDQIIRQQAALLELSKMKDYDLSSVFRFISEISSKASNRSQV